MITDDMRQFMMKQVRENFLRYVKVWTTSDPENETDTPSTERQWDLARILEKEAHDLGLQDVRLSDHCYMYAILPANEAGKGAPNFCLLAHLDASPDQPGENVKPRRIENYDGSVITYPDDPELTLSEKDSPELKEFVGDTIITASGKTLLSADDKAGVAEIMAGIATFIKYPELPHGDIKICFTPDEEIGRGTVKIDEDWLPKFCYTFDGGYPGELEDENFDAWGVTVNVKGVGVHPGYAKNKMVNAVAIVSRYVAALPEWETPEHTELREGFIHCLGVKGD
ncbi:MAG TPA: M20/M25/M40 family metallo-hydrolase, partial [Bacteroidetes bacterium]|nr:M20/M25/M40 family metallo-hydrolase [Bacteroidota bacterium]HEX04487.1 M20/M25/M40 family metallo-hydrolase [Bacteroidota bacterium]